MAGYRVLPMAAAAPVGELFDHCDRCTRGNHRPEHLETMRDDAVLANAGHFDVEIDVRALADMAVEINPAIRPHADEYVLARRPAADPAGRRPGSDLVAAEGNPAAVMDLGFGAQALALVAGQR